MLKTSSCFALWGKRNNISLYRFLSTATDRKRICVVGSGPAGFYTTQHLIKHEVVEVDIFEKLPVPFGLIRYGVAPDHPEIKNCTSSFTQIAMNERVKFYGNIDVGKDVRVADLLKSYHGVVLAFGASKDKEMGIHGENSENVLAARKVVGWYTGHPDFVNEKIDLNTDVATVIGNGNVAVDVARIFLQDLEKLKKTDISELAYEALKKSQIKRVVMVGRRGPFQASFTIKEFRELSKLPNCHIKMPDPILGKIFESGKDLELARHKKRMLQLMTELYQKQNNLSPSEMQKCLEVKFLRTPKEIIPDKNGRIEKIIFKINEINPKDYFEKTGAKLTMTDKEDILNCGLLVRSIGYQSTPIDPDIPFDNVAHIIPNEYGRVINKKGLYCSGWVKTGPIGVLVSTMSSSYETGDTVLKDLANGELNDVTKGRDEILDLLKKKGVKYVTFKDWQKLDKIEQERGQALGKDREKFYNVDDMLKCL
ncbi:NADPH:adrenodoxin oxidoreductase, mitochondrial [Araneus ventricosus]|uniref:NADPH:adrenodoxin oxidoreductase, mitochondrial n=1 Tax=Araneus ventricosus TaxID=182803 RepID=A0A4Y2DI86_ARAVE|nr:NADPH:adrenodoxin oxidoreductase, mitochondrial [Araneus ventricosus]